MVVAVLLWMYGGSDDGKCILIDDSAEVSSECISVLSFNAVKSLTGRRRSGTILKEVIRIKLG